MMKTTNRNKIATEKKTPVYLSTLVCSWTYTTSHTLLPDRSDSTSTPFLMGWDSTSTPALAERTLPLLYFARQQPGLPDCSIPWALPPGSPLERLPGMQPLGPSTVVLPQPLGSSRPTVAAARIQNTKLEKQVGLKPTISELKNKDRNSAVPHLDT